MGLDLFDVTFRIEKTFDLELTEQDWNRLARDGDITAGELYELLLAKLGLRDLARNDLRLNYHLWDQVRHSLHAAASVPLDKIELQTPLAALFPRHNRRQPWNSLREVCPYRVRELDYPPIVRLAALALAAGVILIEQLQIGRIPGAVWLWPVLGWFGLWMLSETYWKVLSVCAPLRTRFPGGMSTVKDLCRAVLAANYVEVCEGVETNSDPRCQVVWAQLVEILAATLGIRADEIGFHSRLIRDLGIS
jgi:hypothetical protein